ncbi:hypothetical protein OIU85_002169 [Salix viminalis]|uniref:Endoglucanase n=1 Tax=Salix viminalis TaxID=40686 RepID=A0A9Q0VMT5_SALVM|nr:hypothetical protein OIU85_002169 [Salix viminalis]
MEEKANKQHKVFRHLKFIRLCTWLLSFFTILPSRHSFNYGEALSKSLLYFESQRSGRLPYNQRVVWRHHSGLTDGLEQGVDLVGGYYDAGDNVKFGLPMAFTITMLSWSVIEYSEQISDAGEYGHALEVGDGDTDHYCWQRPEDMTTSRQAYKVDENNPGSDIAGETAAAMAAASIVFRKTNPHYSHLLLRHAEQLFEFGDKYRGKYDESVKVAKGHYTSVSGYMDELLWAGSMAVQGLRRGRLSELRVRECSGVLVGSPGPSQNLAGMSSTPAFNSSLLRSLLAGKRSRKHQQILKQYRSRAEYYLCACLNKNNVTNVRRTPGGLLYVRQWNNMQYVSAAAFLLTAYSDHLQASNQRLRCDHGTLDPSEIFKFAKSQVDYILGYNPTGMSYLVGYGSKYPERVHHRGASIESYKTQKDFIGCTQGYDLGYSRQGPNPNVLVGALVGGPDMKDRFRDERENYAQTEACTYNTATLVGVFAKLHWLEKDSLFARPSSLPVDSGQQKIIV